jgi:putative flippase GtrA
MRSRAAARLSTISDRGAKVKKLYKKHRELILYVIVGGLTTVVAIVTLLVADYLFKRFSPEFLGAVTTPAAVVSWICAVTFAFIANKVVVFRNKSAKKRQWLKQAALFYAARLATLGFEIVFLLTTVDWLGYNLLLMKVIESVFIVAGNYFISKFVIFKRENDNKNPPE